MKKSDQIVARRIMKSACRKAFVDTQALARTYYPGDVVAAFLGNHDAVGRLLAVYPSTGMVDVQWPHGIERRSVDGIQLVSRSQSPSLGQDADPVQKVVPIQKQAIYWAAPDRKYRASGAEQTENKYMCPSCGKRLIGATHKRQQGANLRLLACWKCKFLVDPCDIEGHPSYRALSSKKAV